MARKRATLTDLLNDATFNMNYRKWRLAEVSKWEYEGLPDGITPKFIENTLFDKGFGIFFKDPEMSHMFLECQNGGRYNVYGEPLKYLATGFNYHKYYNADDCVIIENNLLRLPTHDFIMLYVNKLTDAERTMDVNVKACKTPYIFACDENDILSVKKAFAEIDGNTPAIILDKGLNLESMTVFKTGVTFIGNEMQDYKHSVENDLMTFLGFNNLAVDKKERTNVEEVESNNEIIEIFADLQLKARQAGFDKVNEKYGLDIKVKRKELKPDVDNNPVHDDKDND